MPAPSILLVAGEASGDLHAAPLLRELKRRLPGVTAFGMGGAGAISEGLEALVDAKDISVMGIVEVVPALGRILRAMNQLTAAARERRPALAILIDLPDFNLRLAKRLHGLGIPVAYYVSPTLWAWRPWRIRPIRSYVAKMMCILPFEEPYYREREVEAVYVGHPVVEELRDPAPLPALRAQLGMRIQGPALALLPGSRRSEIRKIFPAQLQAARQLQRERPNLQVVVPVAPTLPLELLQSIANRERVAPVWVAGRAPEVVAACDAAAVASGTAVLEAALMGRPLVVMYRVALISYLVARALVTLDHVALVNLLAGRGIVPELLQGDMTPARIAAELRTLLDDPAARARQRAGVDEVRAKLGGPGASVRAADEVLRLLGPSAGDASRTP